MDGKDAIKRLEIEKKARLLTGDGFWSTAACPEIGMPAAKLSDGPNGMRVQEKRPSNLGIGGSLPATCFPTASATACSFNVKLCERLGEYIGAEAASFGVAMVLGPGLNIKRSPLCGRNFEYFSEDPYLSGKIAAAFVRGVQSKGVTSCIKHFAVNNREYARMFCDSRVDEQTLRETYLTGFEIAVKEGGAGAVMTAYNKLNGVYCNQNSYLIHDILRGEWGFDGLVTSDWGGSHGRVEAVKAGADLEMPYCGMSAAEVVGAVKKGELDERAVDACVERIYNFARRSERLEVKPFDKKAHSDFAEKVAEECVVLLKNERGALPLTTKERIAVIGDFAAKPRFQGAGSSQINPTSSDNILGAIKRSGLNFIGYSKGFKRCGGRSGRLIRRAMSLANRADTVVLCLGLDENSEAEGCDRKTLAINDNQTELLGRLYALGKKIVVVLTCGSAVLTDWDMFCNGLVLGHLGGQSGAGAVVRVLTGEVNPSGRLAETYPVKESDVPCAKVYSASALKTDYAEGIYVGYKYYTSFGVPVKYPFGYGLSYTDFKYSDFAADFKGARVTVTNTGSRAGATVVQIYITAPRGGTEVSPRELKAFEKIFLQAGESREVYLPFDGYSFRIWDADTHRFEAGGDYLISLCADSATVLASATVEITAENLPQGCVYHIAESGKQSYAEYYKSHLTEDVQPVKPLKGTSATLEMPVADLSYCKGLTAKIFGLIVKISKRSKSNLKAAMLDWLSVRSMLQFIGSDDVQTEGFLLACDGHFFRGMKKLFGKKKK